jgi:hypothetical protein
MKIENGTRRYKWKRRKEDERGKKTDDRKTGNKIEKGKDNKEYWQLDSHESYPPSERLAMNPRQ